MNTQLETLILKHGRHKSRTDGMCAMEAVAWLAGEPHSDRPQCACPILSAFITALNDKIIDDQERTRILRPLLPKLLGSRISRTIEKKRRYLALDWLIRVHAPEWLTLRTNLKSYAETLCGLSTVLSSQTMRDAGPQLLAASKAAEATWGATRAAAADATWDAARAAAWDAARAAAWGATRAAAWGAVVDAARAAAWDAARAAAWGAVVDAAWGAVVDAARAAAWDAAWGAVVDAACGDARAAAQQALKPTQEKLQISELELFEQMCIVI